MGSQTSYDALLSHSPKEWFNVGSYHSYEILKNKNTQQKAEEYIVSIEKIYQYRRLQNDHLVSVLQIQKLQTKGICTNMIALKVLTERIPHRISDITTISLPQALYIIKTCLLGFRAIYQNDGPLIIDEQMIGFNENGKVKVWLNPDFGSNQRSLANKNILKKSNPENSYQNQLIMIHQIFNIVVKKLTHQNEENIKSKLKQINGFFSALNFVDDISESYNSINKIPEESFPKKKKVYQHKETKYNKQIRQYSLQRKKPIQMLNNNKQSQLVIERNGSLNRLNNKIKLLSNSQQKTQSSTSSCSSFYKQTRQHNPYGLQSSSTNNLLNLQKQPNLKRFLPPSIPKPSY